MDNYQIADSLSLLSKLMDIHGENSFKSKSYASAAFAVEKLQVPVAELSAEKIASIKGIGSSSAQKIIELVETGRLSTLEDKIKLTPSGVIDMLHIKGIGPKKIHTIWKEMNIETVGELLYACRENRLKLYKGFGEKTQQNVIDSINFYLQHKESHLYAQVLPVKKIIDGFLEKIFPGYRIKVTGSFRQQSEIVDALEYVIAGDENNIKIILDAVEDFEFKEKNHGKLVYTTSIGIELAIYPADAGHFTETIIKTSSSESFMEGLRKLKPGVSISADDEAAYFRAIGLQPIPAYARESESNIQLAMENNIPEPVRFEDIRGIIHSHSHWSDGSQSIEEMAKTAIKKGYEYLVISDHSKSAFYAQGLSEERIREQHRQIDELNSKLHPFKIFKSIESDILNDGSLDYSNEILGTFDLVIASVHSNLKMTEEKAMMRLMNAIENRYTTILGHMTGKNCF